MHHYKEMLFAGILILCLLFSGCIFLIAGAGALGGYAISRDTIQGETDKTFASIWGSSLDVLNIMGTISSEDKHKGTIEAKVSSSDLKVKIEQLTPKAVRLSVSARRYLMPNIGLAQKIYIKVIQRAK